MKKNKDIENTEKSTEKDSENKVNKSIEENSQNQNDGLFWEVDDFIKHPKSKRWYIIASIICLSLVAWAILDKNYLFALILIITSALIVFNDAEAPQKIKVELKYDGLFLGSTFYKFESISKFYILYKPKEKLKKLYFEFKNPLKHRLTISIDDENPIIIRNYLLQFLNEDLEKEDEPFSDAISKIFKI